MTYNELILKEMMKTPYKRFTKINLRDKLEVKDKEIHLFNRGISNLIRDNVVVKTSKGKLCLNKNNNLFIGKFIYNSKGYGFCIKISKPDSNNEIRELFIPPHFVKNALHEDMVVARINKSEQRGQKAEGEILSILERNTHTLVGTFIQKNKDDKFGFVLPDNPKFNMDIYIPMTKDIKAQSYDKVVVKIIKYPEGDRKPEGVIEEILGFKFDSRVDYLSIINEYGFKESFSTKTLHQVERLNEEISSDELKRRKDLTDMCIFTIDGEESKDLDDAISIEKLPNGKYRLGVHIADVTHYVKEDSPLDKDAINRGTSVYLINKVIPMLPKKLSNNLCSLNPLETKLTLSVFMNINSRGIVEKHEIFESYINSKSKLWYKNVSDFLENKADLIVDEKIKDTPMENKIKESLKVAEELQHILKNKRLSRGALDFQFDESYITLDENDKPLDVKAYERRIANEIIEECMVVTNETIAEHFNKLDIPFVYRVHEKPKEEKISTFLNFIDSLEYELPSDLSSKSLQEILKQAEGKTEEEAINLLLLQSMKQAKYHPDELGHFGLGATYYSHFTSPIRRYPDLQIHRIIKDYINGRLNKVRIEKLRERVDFTSRISSKRERQAQNAEMDFDNIKKAEFMQDKIDNEYEGIIISISRSQCKVMLPNTVEGIIPLNKFGNEEFKVYKEGCSLIGLDSNKEVVIGSKIKVKVTKVIPDEQLIVFSFIDIVE